MNRLPTSAPAPVVLAASITGAALLLTGCGTTTSDAGGTATVASASDPSQPSSASSPAVTTADAAETAPTAIPAELRLPHEGEDGWTAANWQYVPCEGVELTLDAASDSRTIEQEVVASYSAETLAVFPDEQAAATFMAELEEGSQSCGTFDTGDRMTTVAVRPLEGRWEQGLVVYHSALLDHSTSEDPAHAAGGEYLLAARNRNAVAMSHGVGEWVSSSHPEPNPEAVATYREPLDELVPALCSFAEEDC